jgi:hypothetical protein
MLRERKELHTPIILRLLSKCTKILGKVLADGLSRLNLLVKQRLEGFKPAIEGVQQAGEGMIGEQSANSGRRPIKVKFADFHCTEEELEAVELEHEKKQEKKLKRQARAYAFDYDDYSDDLDSDSSDLNPNSMTGTKRLKKDTTIEYQDQGIVKAITAQTPQIQDHFGDLWNRVIKEACRELTEVKEKQKKAQSRDRNEDETDKGYRNYIQSINQGSLTTINQRYEDPRKQLANMKRRTTERNEQRPTRKMTHTEEEAPPMYNVKTVLDTLDQQSEEFVNNKRKALEEQLRA